LLAASPHLTNLNFLCESGALVSTVGTPSLLQVLPPRRHTNPPRWFLPDLSPRRLPCLHRYRCLGSLRGFLRVSPQHQGLAVRSGVQAVRPPILRSWRSDRALWRFNRPVYRGWRSDLPRLRGWRCNRHTGRSDRPCCCAMCRFTTSRVADFIAHLRTSSTTTRGTIALAPAPDAPRHRPTSAVLVTPPVNPQLLVMRGKDGFWLPGSPSSLRLP
jgi:hypothetical protein